MVSEAAALAGEHSWLELHQDDRVTGSIPRVGTHTRVGQ